MPNALWLNSRAREVLEGSIGEDDDYNEKFFEHYNEANMRMTEAFDELAINLRNLKFFVDELGSTPAEITAANEAWAGEVESIPAALNKIVESPDADIEVVNQDLRECALDSKILTGDLIEGYRETNADTKADLENLILETEENAVDERENLRNITEINLALEESNSRLSGSISDLEDVETANDKLTQLEEEFGSEIVIPERKLEELPNALEEINHEINMLLEEYAGGLATLRSANYSALESIPAEIELSSEEVNAELLKLSREAAIAKDANYEIIETIPAAIDTITSEVDELLKEYALDVEVARQF